jgi:beta-mannosidase
MKLSHFITFFFLFYNADSFAQNTILEQKLHTNWQFQQKGTKKWYKATVPGCIHTDLIANGIIEDPYYRLNESKVQWIDKEDWIYKSSFNLNNENYKKQHHEIEFEGLDTYASVYLNDSLILESNNMHRTYVVDVKSYIKIGENNFKIILESPIRKGLELYNSLNYTIPVSANDQAEVGQVDGGKRVSIFTRKAGYHYGWDWGPRLVTSGIWRPVTLRSWDDVRIKNFNISYSFDGPTFIKTDLLIESSIKNKNASLLISINDSTVVSKELKLVKGEQNSVNHFSLKNTKLWWPNGLGEQNLYDFKAEIQFNNRTSSVEEKLGFKAIFLEVKDTTQSPNFYFNVNGAPTFAKGVNYIPQDVFLNRVKNSDYETLLVDAAKANMNMIRVWGGGIYENNRFYELCDSLGLMVWQDFMFACAMYPGDSAFLENVRLEATDNYNRLKRHTCIVLWCGNNENLAAWKRWGWESKAIKDQSQEVADKIWRHYDTLFHHILPQVVYENHPEHGFGRSNDWPGYWSSSPSASEGIPESYKIGDTHYWGVWWGKEPFENYNTKISSFMSEYGFQSFPSYQTFKQFGKKKDEDMYSKVMKHHQRSSIGNATIEEYMKREYLPAKNFESLLYMSQIVQADGIKIAIEAHRRNKAKCMGSLYWQLNDCWPGASWSSIDYYGKWKALHYQIKKAFEPIILSHEFIDSNLHVTAISDLNETFIGEIEIRLLNFKSSLAIKSWIQPTNLKPFENSRELMIPYEEFSNDKKNSYLQFIFRKNGEVISRKNLFLAPFKTLNNPQPKISYTSFINKNKIMIDVNSSSFAKGIFISSKSKSNFSENFFDLNSQESKTIFIEVKEGENPQEIRESIKILDVWNATHKPLPKKKVKRIFIN